MSEGASGDTETSARSEQRGGRRRRASFDAAKARARVVGILATVVRWIGNLAALLLMAHVVLTVGRANPDNGITRFVADWAEPLALGFQDLFTPADPRAAVLVNYGIAALFWLFATSVAVRIVRALG